MDTDNLPSGKMSIIDLIQIRVSLGNEDQVESECSGDIILALDRLILEFIQSLNPTKGN